jgi:hypothetical protein
MVRVESNTDGLQLGSRSEALCNRTLIISVGRRFIKGDNVTEIPHIHDIIHNAMRSVVMRRT